MNKEILWFCWPEKYRKSWVWNYSNLFIKELKKRWYNIKDIWLQQKSDILRIFYQFFIIPLKVIFCYRNRIKIFWDEWMLFYTLYPFFPYQNSIFIVHDIRDFNLSAKNKNIYQKVYFWLLEKAHNNMKKAETIVVVSQFTKDLLIKEYWVKSENIKLIYNAFDLSIFKKLDSIEWTRDKLFKKYRIESDKKIILNVWSEESRKNIITILKVMDKLDDYVFIKLWRPIVTKNREEHLKYIKEHWLEGKVYFLDYIEDMDDFVWFYNISDIFLFPSLFEWFWRPPIEAEACWCPVISSKEWSLWEVLNDSCLIINNPEDVDEIIGLIGEVEKNKERMINKWLENCKRFELNKNTDYWWNLLLK